MRVVRCLAATLALALLLGLHWTLLQTFAWTRMFVEFSRVESFASALSMTFDGQHRCSLCRAVQNGRDADRSRPPARATERFPFECDLPSGGPSLDHPRPHGPAPRPSEHAASRRDPPPRPRPRSLPAA